MDPQKRSVSSGTSRKPAAPSRWLLQSIKLLVGLESAACAEVRRSSPNAWHAPGTEAIHGITAGGFQGPPGAAASALRLAVGAPAIRSPVPAAAPGRAAAAITLCHSAGGRASAARHLACSAGGRAAIHG